jgi:hypothetical protein
LSLCHSIIVAEQTHRSGIRAMSMHNELIAWLLARDEYLRPPCVLITEFTPLCSPDEWLYGLPLRAWEYGERIASSRHGECGFSRINGSGHYKAFYQWAPLVGAGYLLEWSPQENAFKVELQWVS